MYIAYNLSTIGRHEEAIEMVHKAINLGSHESSFAHNTLLSHLAEYYRRAGRFEEAIETGQKLLDSNPSSKYRIRACITMVCAYSALGNDEEANAIAVDIMQIRPNFSLGTEAKKDSYYGFSVYDWFMNHEPDMNLLMNALRKARLE